MAIYHKWKCIFIQIPKNASTSIHEKLSNRTDNEHGRHYTFFDIMHQHDPELFESYFSFSVIRNPYDRFVSAYEFDKLSVPHPPFDDFVNKIYNDYQRSYNNYPTYFIPQYKFVSIKNVILVDDIIRFENINNDWQRIVNILNSRHNFMPISNILDVLNVTPTKMNIPWEDYYSNNETKEKIYTLYKKDFEIFQYNR